jgi:hypothetical protein
MSFIPDGSGVYLAYYHQDRTHIALEKDTPVERTVHRVLLYNLESCPYRGWVVFIIAVRWSQAA